MNCINVDDLMPGSIIISMYGRATFTICHILAIDKDSVVHRWSFWAGYHTYGRAILRSDWSRNPTLVHLPSTYYEELYELTAR